MVGKYIFEITEEVVNADPNMNNVSLNRVEDGKTERNVVGDTVGATSGDDTTGPLLDGLNVDGSEKTEGEKLGFPVGLLLG